MPRKLLRIPEVAYILNVTTDRAYQLVREGVLPVVRMGPRQLRVDESQLQAWIQAGGQVHSNRLVREETIAN